MPKIYKRIAGLITLLPYSAFLSRLVDKLVVFSEKTRNKELKEENRQMKIIIKQLKSLVKEMENQKKEITK